MSMTRAEEKVLEKFKNKGYKFLRNGHPDFLFYKEINGRIQEAIFIEVKRGNDGLRKDQLIYRDILLALNVPYILEIIQIPERKIKEEK